MKEIKDLHIKADVVMHLFEQILTNVPFEHFKPYKEQILEKSADETALIKLNEEVLSALIEDCIDLIYSDIASKQKLSSLRDELMNVIENEINAGEGEDGVMSERSLNYQRLMLKHLNVMYNYSSLMLDNLADNININIK